MAVYVNKLRRRFGTLTFCHLLADSEDELHAMAARLGLERGLFGRDKMPHYDISRAKHAQAMLAGAVAIDRDQLEILIKRYQQQ